MKVSGKFGKVIFAKTELLKKITIVFVSFKSRKTAYGREVSIFRPKGLQANNEIGFQDEFESLCGRRADVIVNDTDDDDSEWEEEV